jgi:hypothetical protein
MPSFVTVFIDIPRPSSETDSNTNDRYTIAITFPTTDGNITLDQVQQYLNEFFNNNNNTSSNITQEEGQQQPRPRPFVLIFPSQNVSFEEILHRSFMEHQQRNNGPPPASKQKVDELPRFELTEERRKYQFENHALEQNNCGVCLEDFQVGDQLIQVPCQHCFHVDCLQPWISEHNTCPTCRFELAVDDKELEKDRIKRMTERFSKEGLEIMEIGTSLDVIYDRIDRVRNSNPIDQKELNACELILTNAVNRLDDMQEFRDTKIREQRRYQVAKVQSLLKMIDELRCRDQLKETVDFMCIDEDRMDTM